MTSKSLQTLGESEHLMGMDAKLVLNSQGLVSVLLNTYQDSLHFFNQLLWVLRFAAITVELSISHCSSISVYLLHVETLLSCTYVFRIAML